MGGGPRGLDEPLAARRLRDRQLAVLAPALSGPQHDCRAGALLVLPSALRRDGARDPIGHRVSQRAARAVCADSEPRCDQKRRAPAPGRHGSSHRNRRRASSGGDHQRPSRDRLRRDAAAHFRGADPRRPGGCGAGGGAGACRRCRRITAAAAPAASGTVPQRSARQPWFRSRGDDVRRAVGGRTDAIAVESGLHRLVRARDDTRHSADRRRWEIPPARPYRPHYRRDHGVAAVRARAVDDLVGDAAV